VSGGENMLPFGEHDNKGKGLPLSESLSSNVTALENKDEGVHSRIDGGPEHLPGAIASESVTLVNHKSECNRGAYQEAG
jgi:hypothetical protein